MHAHWYNLPSFLTPKECTKLIKHALRYYQPKDATVGHGGAGRTDHNIRTSVVRWLDFCDLDLLWFYRRIERAVLEANRDCFGYHIQHASTELQFTEYHGSQGGEYKWHADSSAIKKTPMDRKLSFVIQLSDPADYEGGRFEIKGDELRPGSYTQQGDALIFRSCLDHCVHPVTRGVRYSFVTWFHGPRA